MIDGVTSKIEEENCNSLRKRVVREITEEMKGDDYSFLFLAIPTIKISFVISICNIYLISPLFVISEFVHALGEPGIDEDEEDDDEDLQSPLF